MVSLWRVVAALLCSVAGAGAFAPAPSLMVLHLGPARPAQARALTVAPRMQGDDNDQGGRREKWSVAVQDEAAERIESVKAGVLSAVAGSIAMAPIALMASSAWYPSDAFSAQWELAHDGLAVMLGLFGLVYRYAVRQDPNPQLKQGVVGAFVITRALAMLQASEDCSALPLSCGAPLGYFNWEMIATGLGAGVESALAFAASAAAIEVAFSKGWVRRFPS